MGVKNEVLAIFETSRGQLHSGQSLGDALGVSRNAVWKAIRQLQQEGHAIAAVSNQGYCLSPDSNILSPQSLRPFLRDARLLPTVHSSIPSTNTALRQLAEEGAPEGTVLLAEEQTQGQGRRDHRFFSPSGGGLYMSLLLRPTLTATDALSITTCAAVCVAQAIERLGGPPAQIKWVNDIFCGGKKVCGIATLGSVDLESGGLRYAVLGIGINVFAPAEGFPPELANVAGSVFSDAPHGDLRSRLAGEVLSSFMEEYPHLSQRRFFTDYRQRCFVLGQPVEVLHGDKAIPAHALDLDRDFRLLVRYHDGREEALSSGEVRVRPQL